MRLERQNPAEQVLGDLRQLGCNAWASITKSAEKESNDKEECEVGRSHVEGSTPFSASLAVELMMVFLRYSALGGPGGRPGGTRDLFRG
jgi:hypothetical protein